MWIHSGILLPVCLFCNVWFTPRAATGKEADKLLVSTKYGKLRGKQFSVKGTDVAVNAFLGIPYAKPPVGDLRFSPPQPAEPWNNVRDATSYPELCVQMLSYKGMQSYFWRTELPVLPISEDCLYVSVYCPADTKGKQLPVMVWLHGGGFIYGGASFYDGSALAAYGGVAVVTVQYRLGTLGFFSTGDDVAPGNWGLLDQVAALQWVQENIEDFCGDRHSVTIFGESAGGASVSAHLLSPMSRGLFHKVISESGVTSTGDLICTDHEVILQHRNMIANAAGCEITDSAALLDCMRSISVDKILEPFIKQQILLLPGTVDGVFLLKDPEDIMAEGQCNHVPYLIGVNNDECGWFFPNIARYTDLENGIKKEDVNSSLQHFQPMLGSLYEYMPSITKEYLKNTSDPIKIRDSFLAMLADGMFVFKSIKVARYQRDCNVPVYFYEFQHRLSINDGIKPNYTKADHGDELLLVFGLPFWNGDMISHGNFTDAEKDLSKQMMKLWSNFAKHGNPNGDGSSEWPCYDHHEKYLEINLQQKIGTKLRDDKMKLWSKILSGTQ